MNRHPFLGARACLLALFTALLALPAPALAQGGPSVPPSSDLERRVAKTYGLAGWDAPAPAREGFDLEALAPLGWRQVSLARDARRGEATAGFRRATPGEPAPSDAPEVLVTIQVHASAALARRALVLGLAACQAQLAPERAGDLAFGGRREGRLELLMGTFGNVSFRLRALAEVDAAPCALALDDALRAAPAMRGAAPVAPRLLGLEAAGVARVGAPVRLELTFDPSAPAPAALSFDAGAAGAVVETAEGYLLYPARTGRLELRVSACASTLGRTHKVLVVEVSE